MEGGVIFLMISLMIISCAKSNVNCRFDREEEKIDQFVAVAECLNGPWSSCSPECDHHSDEYWTYETLAPIKSVFY